VKLGFLLFSAVALVACAASNPPANEAAPKAAGALPASLIGTRWMGVIDPSLEKRAVPWLEFVAEGRVSGYTGCNLLSGKWVNEGGQVRIGPLITTKRGCMGPESDVERRLLNALNEKSRVTRDGAKLVFTGEGGERFEFVEAKGPGTVNP
jgi:heat shock protein HslJ